jgi:hypothetical protein
MAVRLKRKLNLGRGVKGYTFEIEKKPEHDRQIYIAGLKLENSLLQNAPQEKQATVLRSVFKKQPL